MFIVLKNKRKGFHTRDPKLIPELGRQPAVGMYRAIAYIL